MNCCKQTIHPPDALQCYNNHVFSASPGSVGSLFLTLSHSTASDCCCCSFVVPPWSSSEEATEEKGAADKED